MGTYGTVKRARERRTLSICQSVRSDIETDSVMLATVYKLNALSVFAIESDLAYIVKCRLIRFSAIFFHAEIRKYSFQLDPRTTILYHHQLLIGRLSMLRCNL